MTDHHLRDNTHVLPHRGQGHPDRPQHRLHHLNPVQPRLVIPTQHPNQIHPHKRCQRPLTLPQPVIEHPAPTHQTRRHPHRLRTLTRKHEHRTRTHTSNRTHHHIP